MVKTDIPKHQDHPRHQDPVAQRILAAGDHHAVSALQWLDSKQSRSVLRRRATWCVIASWLMVTSATAVGAFVSWNFSRNADDIFFGNVPLITVILPPVLITLVCLSLVGGVLAFLNNAFPGLSTTNEAIDWSNMGDAVSRLLAVGCTYPEAFHTAAKVACTRRSRTWLAVAANEVEQGGFDLTRRLPSKGDSAIVELLVQSDESNPSHGWRVVADHFIEVAHSRFGLLLSTGPILSTLLAGLILWMSISATLGAMWRHALQSIQGLS